MVFEGGADTLFKDVSVFDKNYIPKVILHRDREIHQIETALQFILGGFKATDCVLYGFRGTGKTMIAGYLMGELKKRTRDFRYFYVSLSNTQTQFKALQEILVVMGIRNLRGVGFNEGIRMMFDNIKNYNETNIVFILDEINKVQEYDSLLYSFLRENEVYGEINGKKITYIFITNDFKFPSNISEGTKSSFSGVNRIIFEPYDANQLRDILLQRVDLALKPGVLDETIIPLCAALSAQEHGDARKTIKLLAKATELAIRDGANKVIEKHVYRARDEIEYEAMAELVKTLPLQLRLIALAIARCTKNNENHKSAEPVTTGGVYKEYKQISKTIGLDGLTQRRVTDLLTDLVTLGLIEAQIKYLGRYGRTRHVELMYPANTIEAALAETPLLDSFKPVNYMVQSKLGEKR